GHRPAVPAEDETQRIQDRRLVLDDQYVSHFLPLYHEPRANRVFVHPSSCETRRRRHALPVAADFQMSAVMARTRCALRRGRISALNWARVPPPSTAGRTQDRLKAGP